ncbi:uncharacterized protein LOC134681742 [Mytilus trossulus]|uniref:uncharacterized protein LOC134681742 n=1 Tax=Mytilus trossulus TaxID=6551 RepID=UPI003004D91C
MERKKRSFFHMGQLVALSILEDGPGLPIFSEAATDYILEGCIKSLHINDLPDVVKEKLNQMDRCTSDEAVKQVYSTMEEERTGADFLVPVLKFNREMISSFKSALVEHPCSSCKEELDQFIRGLDTHQVLGLLRQDENKTKVRVLFSGQVKPLTALALRQMMVFKYSEGNRRLGEMRTGQGFLTFLQAASKKTDSKAQVNGIVVTLEDILVWLSGARFIPAAGFHKKIDVEFSNAVQVNTCALTLTLKIEENMTPEDAVVHYAGLLINSQTFTME